MLHVKQNTSTAVYIKTKCLTQWTHISLLVARRTSSEMGNIIALQSPRVIIALES